MTFRWPLVIAGLAASLSFGSPAYAVTELQWWHAMTGANNDVVNRLANDFNASQRDYKVIPVAKGNYSETMNASIAAFRAGNAPHIVQVYEVGTATMVGTAGAIKPVFQLMKDANQPFDPKAYLPSVSGYFSTSNGDMLSLPFNVATMVMWVNKDALKAAGVTAIPTTWPDVFDAARKLRAAGHPTCGFSNAWTTWAHIEQFSAWHDVPVASKANGLDGFDTTLSFNTPLLIRHLESLAELQRDRSYDYSGRTNVGDARFISGECALFLTSSALFGNVKAQAKFSFAAAPMPYYPDVKGAPQNAIVGGASLWAMAGKSAEEYKGVAKFFAFLSNTDRQVRLQKAAGYLPITRAAYDKAKAEGFYKEHPYLETSILELTGKNPTGNSRGLRLGNMLQLRDVWSEEIEHALAGRKTARLALDAAVERGNALLRQFERTAAPPLPAPDNAGPVSAPADAQAARPTPVTPAPGQGRRIALVIGNSAYKNVEALTNPRRDAATIADLLRRVGFQSVTLLTDLDREGFVRALQSFAQAADNADWSVVYYAGHGMEAGGVNYLIPTDATLATDRDIDLQAVPLSTVLNATERARKLSLIILDACRDNPFASQMKRTLATSSRAVARGLARVEPEAGTMVVYAAKHGETALDGDAGNSPFVTALAKNVERPGLEVRLLFDNVRDDVMDMTNRRQQPFTYGSISGRQQFYFVPPK